MADVLLVEDDDDLAFLIDRTLSGDGHQVLREGTAGGALAALDASPFDVVVTDLGLPDASGVVVCEAGRDRGVPVVVITANEKLRVIPTVAECARVVISKPFALDELTAAVDDAAAA